MTNEQPPEPAPPPPAPETAITLPRGPGAVATDAAQSVPLTAPDDEEDPRWLTKADWLLLGLLVALSFVIGISPALNSDVWLQLATGRLIAHGDYLPGGAEPFSVATEAREGQAAVPWINHSWLFALILYAAYTGLGPIGVVVLKGLLVAAVTVVLIQVRNRDTNLLILAICLTLSVLAMGVTGLFLQPVLVSFLMLALTLLILHRAGVFDAGTVDEDAGPRNEKWLWALPALFVLWVNLDNWFVLGPLTVGLCLAGVAIERWRGQAVRVPVGRLGLVFGVGLLACCISPFHVRVFQLPPELAYLCVRAADLVGIDLPDAIFGGGRTAMVLREAAQESHLLHSLTLSPLSEGFLRNAQLGYNVCGVCFFPLLLLGLASFAIAGIVAGKPGAPAPHTGRFLVWLVFAVLAALLYRMIPFFAIVAGPITALNFGELLAWYVTSTAAGEPPMPWVAPARLIRILGVPLMVVLAMLAWPGWLNGPFEPDSFRHVVWDIPVDPSMRMAALRLQELHEQQHAAGSGVRVFSTGLDMTPYCAWFAPGVKGFVDTRHNLFPAAVKDYFAARAALWDKSRLPTDWSSILRAYRMDHVAAENFMIGRPQQQQIMDWWQDAAQWRQDFADRKVALFTWSGPRPHWPTDAVLAKWNAQAFGAVPEQARPPAKGPAAPPQNRSLFDRYWEAPPPFPEVALQLDAKRLYGLFVIPRSLELAKRTQHISTYPLASLPLAPGACQAPFGLALTSGMILAAANMQPRADMSLQEFKAYKSGLWTAMDFQPPAVPVLSMRAAWQAVAAAPANERCYLVLANATAAMREQEAYWINPLGEPPQTLRNALRQVQVMSALQAAIEVGVSEPQRQLQIHLDLYDAFWRMHALDLALEQLLAAEEVVNATPPVSERQKEERQQTQKMYVDRRKRLEAEVERRRNDFKVRTSSRSNREKLVELRFGTFTWFTKDNRVQKDPQGWGLTGLQLQLLRETNPADLSDKDKLPHAHELIDLLFRVGYARQAAELLESVQDALPREVAAPLQIFRAGTDGNYDELRAVLAKLEPPTVLPVQRKKEIMLACSAAMLLPPPTWNQIDYMTVYHAGQQASWTSAFREWQGLAGVHYSLLTLRGIVTLEAGDTAEARRIFDQVVRESAGVSFAERRIAERYAILLADYQKR